MSMPNTSDTAESSSQDTAKQKLSEAAEHVRAAGQKVKEAAQTKLDDLREAAFDACRQQTASMQDVAHSVEEYIRQHPLKSVLAAAGVGAVLGWLCARR